MNNSNKSETANISSTGVEIFLGASKVFDLEVDENKDKLVSVPLSTELVLKTLNISLDSTPNPTKSMVIGESLTAQIFEGVASDLASQKSVSNEKVQLESKTINKKKDTLIEEKEKACSLWVRGISNTTKAADLKVLFRIFFKCCVLRLYFRSMAKCRLQKSLLPKTNCLPPVLVILQWAIRVLRI